MDGTGTDDRWRQSPRTDTNRDPMNESLPPRGLPREKTIDVWQIQLDSSLNHVLNLDDFLSVEERNRANRFVFAKDAFRFRTCRALVRLGLAWYMRKTPDEVILTTGEYGKPRLTDPSALHFNVTHSGELGLLAFTTIGDVGIDVESVRHNIDALDIASARFTTNEIVLIAAAGMQREQARTFLRLWTRKEAVLKAAGFGILHGLDTVDVSQQSANLVGLKGRYHERSESCWLVKDLELLDGFIGSDCSPARRSVNRAMADTCRRSDQLLQGRY